MTGGKLWGYVASGARALGGLGPLGRSGALVGVRLLKGVGGGGRPEPDGRAVVFGGAAGTAGTGGAGRPGSGGMAGPQPLSRPELERLRWTDRAGGCVPDARHVQPAELVGRVLRGGGRAAAVTVRVPVGLPVVVADSVRLEAALAGLVDHAIRRNPPGARVLVRADPFSGPWAAEPARVELRVVDRGASAPPEARQWLLGAVHGRAAGRTAGGPERVGPSIPGLVQAAGGRLVVEQTPGGGLTVVVVLAVARE
ncbi:ATP-binding protein [Kitasatospora sp. NPDC015120]|uniref:ATP-binding protein n=1 Tax=Kitasatospora sp. NPDC015120 TaxID=3364023 RepID=UPI0036F46F1C